MTRTSLEMAKFSRIVDVFGAFLRRISSEYDIPLVALKHEFDGIMNEESSRKKCGYQSARAECRSAAKEGLEYCARHQKMVEARRENGPALVSIQESKKAIPIVINRSIGRYVHTETRMVFFSKEERVVFGRLNEVGDIVRLQEADEEICRTYGFRMDPSRWGK